MKNSAMENPHCHFSKKPPRSRPIIVFRRGLKKFRFWKRRCAQIQKTPARLIIWAICFMTAAAMMSDSTLGKINEARFQFFDRLAQSRHRLFQYSQKTDEGAGRLRQSLLTQIRQTRDCFLSATSFGNALGEKPEKRLRELEKFPRLVSQRDDLSVELCALYNQTGQPEKALEILTRRKFQPWEGGEGQALGQHVRTHLALGREALARNDFAGARAAF